jgi:thioredoxin 2
MIVICPRCSAANRLDAGRAHDEPVCGKCGTALLDGKPIAIDDARFERFVTRNELPVVVDFWAAWCGPCRAMAPQFEQAASRLKGEAILAKVDSDASPQASSRFGIRSIPTLVLFRDGKEIKRQAGAVQAAQIVSWVQAASQPA